MIVSRSDFEGVIAKLSLPGLRALDTETTGLRVHHGDKLFSIIIHEGEQTYYFNFQTYQGLDLEFVLPREYLWRFDQVLSNKESSWFLANAKYDMHILANEELFIAGDVHCTEAVGRVERSDELKYGLDALAKRIGLKKSDAVDEYIKKHALWEWELIPGKKKRNKKKFFDRVPIQIMQTYAEQDGRITDQVGRHQMQVLSDIEASTAESLPVIGAVVYNEKKLTKTCFEMERIGIKIDRKYCEEALAWEEGRFQGASGAFKALTGYDFQDSETLFSDIFKGIELPKTEKGNPSFDESALKSLASPVAQAILTCRDAHKKANTYYRNFLYFADHNDVVRANIKQGGTVTGRVSVTDPALQTVPDEEGENIPFKVRRAFIPRPGFFFLLPDYEQMEYKLMLDYAGQKDIISLVLGGMDVHEATALMIKQALGIEITRGQAKTINFGILYGMGNDALALALGTTRDKARSLKYSYFQALPQVQYFIQRVTKRAESTGYIFNWAGRRTYFKDPSFCYKAPNALIQGGCGDVVKFAMNSLADLLGKYKTKMLMQEHDELIFEMSRDEMFLIPQIKEIMESVYPYRFLKLTTSVEHSFKSWGDKVKGAPHGAFTS